MGRQAVRSMKRDGLTGRVSVVIPTLDEEASIAATIRSIPQERMRDRYSVDVIVVDGLSKDRTASIASSLGARVISEPRKGYGRAYRTGFDAAKDGYIVALDGDGTYPGDAIPRLLGKAESEGLDFITTDRFADMEKGAMGLRNRAGNRMLTLMMNLLFGTRLHDSQSGMWLLRKDAWERIRGPIRGEGMEFSEELKIEAFRKLRCAEVPIRYSARKGQAKLDPWRDGLRNLVHLFRKRLRM